VRHMEGVSRDKRRELTADMLVELLHHAGPEVDRKPHGGAAASWRALCTSPGATARRQQVWLKLRPGCGSSAMKLTVKLKIGTVVSGSASMSAMCAWSLSRLAPSMRHTVARSCSGTRATALADTCGMSGMGFPSRL